MQFAVLQEYNEALGSDKSVINYAHHNFTNYEFVEFMWNAICANN